ncbi:MAG: hypothetical protein SW833_17640 [Cyanobacteriota bacterium]|nr:hypothetical protein [Cyanobacteriota bacterium]
MSLDPVPSNQNRRRSDRAIAIAPTTATLTHLRSRSAYRNDIARAAAKIVATVYTTLTVLALE